MRERERERMRGGERLLRADAKLMPSPEENMLLTATDVLTSDPT